MNTPDDPYIVIANLMAFRLARVESPSPTRMANEAKVAGEMLFHAEKEGVAIWRELRRKHRDAEKKASEPLTEKKPPPEKPLSSSSAASYSGGDTA